MNCFLLFEEYSNLNNTLQYYLEVDFFYVKSWP